MPVKGTKAPKGLFRKFLIVFNISVIITTVIIALALHITGSIIYGEEYIIKKIGVINTIIKFAPVLGAVSYTHSPSPRDRQKSRMPSSA